MQKRNEIIIIVISVLIFAGLIAYNYLEVQKQNKILERRLEWHQELEALQIEKVTARELTSTYIILRSLTKSQETADIIKFDTKYKKIESQYFDEINIISDEFEKKVTNIEDLKSLVKRRSRAAEDFKQALIGIEDIPETINSFYLLVLDFLENDISTWNEVLEYYSENFSNENPSIIQNQSVNELYLRNMNLYMQVEALRLEIYTEFGLESLL